MHKVGNNGINANFVLIPIYLQFPSLFIPKSVVRSTIYAVSKCAIRCHLGKRGLCFKIEDFLGLVDSNVGNDLAKTKLTIIIL